VRLRCNVALVFVVSSYRKTQAEVLGDSASFTHECTLACILTLMSTKSCSLADLVFFAFSYAFLKRPPSEFTLPS